MAEPIFTQSDSSWALDVSNDEDVEQQLDYDRFRNERTMNEDAPDSEECILLMSAHTTHALTVCEVLATEQVPEFPKTSELGSAYLVNTSQMTKNQHILATQMVQYCKKQAHPHKTSHCQFLSARCVRKTYQCTGVKYCEYIDPEINNMHHNNLQPEDFQKIIDLQRLRTGSTRRQQANSLFIATQEQFISKKACGSAHEETCKPVFQRSTSQNLAGNFPCFIACKNKSQHNRHYFKPITGWLIEEFGWLADRFSPYYLPEDETCFVSEQLATRRTTCGIDHPKGRGQLRPSGPCNVVFRLIEPIEGETCPYFIWTSHGTHNHPPPIPSVAPRILVDGLISVIQRINDPSLTTGSLLRNPLMREFYEGFQRQSIGEIHNGFANMDRLSLILKKQQLLLYPEGQAIASLRHEHWRGQATDSNPYIQYFDTTTDDLMVICCLKRSAEIFMSLEAFEVDMTFKRVKDAKINEVVFAAFLPSINKVMTFVRVYVNHDTTLMYAEMFQEVFKVLAQLSGKPVRWQHIHGDGFGALVMDSCFKQTTGFGLYLSSIDPEGRGWRFHTRSSIIYCAIHFQRGIVKAAGTQENSFALKQRMASLLEAGSRDDYYEICDLLLTSNHTPKAVKDWTRHKQQLGIASGINRHISLMSNALFERTRRHTNAVEQSHHKAASLGKRLSLLKAVKNGEVVDRRDVDQHDAKVNHGVNSSYRTNSLSARFIQHEARSRSKKRKANPTTKEIIDLDGHSDEDLEILASASSCGYSSGSQSSHQPRKARNVASQKPQTLRHAASTNLLQQNQSTLLDHAEVDLQIKKAKARALELENEKQELMLIKLRKEIQDS